jgi:protein tyrosine/serine phosphatase
MKIKHLLIISTMIMTSSQIFAESVNLLTLQDIKNPNSAMPKNFRDLSNLGINAIASAQFSEEQLKEVRKKYPNEKITIIDLRRENHGFVNGEVVVWHSVFEKGNDRKSTAEILSEEKYLLKTAQKNGEIVINTVKKRDRENGWYSEVEPKVVVVKRVSNEENLAKENGFSYKRFSVRDFDMPDEKEFNKMVKFIKKLPKDQKLYVHCAGGKGRTGLFLVTLDIIKNGKNVELEEIFARQNKLGAARLDEISEEEAWTKDLAQIRLKMLQDFYEKETD